MTPRRVLLTAVPLLGLILAGAPAVDAAPVKATVDAVTGTVEFAPPASTSFAPLKKGQVLDVGSTVRTGSDGTAVIVTTPGSAVEVGRSSNLKINALAFSQANGKVTQRQAHLQLDSGVVSALINPAAPKVNDFQVQTPQGVAAARGTFYAVVVDHGKTFVGVQEGKVGAEAVAAQ